MIFFLSSSFSSQQNPINQSFIYENSDVSTNKLSGTIPTELQNYARLEDL